MCCEGKYCMSPLRVESKEKISDTMQVFCFNILIFRIKLKIWKVMLGLPTFRTKCTGDQSKGALNLLWWLSVSKNCTFCCNLFAVMVICVCYCRILWAIFVIHLYLVDTLLLFRCELCKLMTWKVGKSERQNLFQLSLFVIYNSLKCLHTC